MLTRVMNLGNDLLGHTEDENSQCLPVESIFIFSTAVFGGVAVHITLWLDVAIEGHAVSS